MFKILKLFIFLFVLLINNNASAKPVPPGAGDGDEAANILFSWRNMMPLYYGVIWIILLLIVIFSPF